MKTEHLEFLTYCIMAICGLVLFIIGVMNIIKYLKF